MSKKVLIKCLREIIGLFDLTVIAVGNILLPQTSFAGGIDLEDMSPFVGLLISLFWTFGDICPGFLSHGRFPCLHASSPTRNGFLRLASGPTPADLLAASMATEPFLSSTNITLSHFSKLCMVSFQTFGLCEDRASLRF